jgi:hypothetical protein
MSRVVIRPAASSGVTSVNGQTGVVVLDAADVGAVESVNGQTNVVVLDADDVGAVATVTGDGVDNTDPTNPVVSFPTPADIGAVALPNYGMLSFVKNYHSIPETGLLSAISLNFTGSRPRNTYSPFVITKSISITSALLYVATGTAGTIVDAFIVPADNDWQPVQTAIPIQIMTNIDCSTNGFKEQTGLSVTLTSGRYLIVHVQTINQSTYTCWSYYIENWASINSAVSQLSRTAFGLTLSATGPLDLITSINIQNGGPAITPILLKWEYV